ncbi:C-glycoside deglycosidase beta subunit domain-containing protein [Arthrobacter sp. P2b]|uniref:C-glycoside deglycosidase beta subunit domain-containing protein n=1 Tax=Arthrobacter sp. P2b TaxID=1938741 RepID=UPI0009CCBB71|nr:DUF6379 domain-containing protein [Arthrobacter sp. P2b]SLJ91065.1 hypothetical protein SAMN06272721_101117 [Arthrobacter sp. P2b]
MVLERELIQSRGFRNVQEGTDTVGFEIALRMPNYRGLWGSLIDGASVTVDGREWSREVPRWTLQGRTFSIEELRRSTDVRWQLDELATITVPLEGGLAVGVHDVRVDIALYAPYIPAEFQPSIFTSQRKVTVLA